MKHIITKLTCAFLSGLLITIAAGCSGQPQQSQDTQATQATQATHPTQSESEAVSADVKEKLDKTLSDEQYSGIVRISKGGEVIYEYVNGKDDNGKPLTMDASMPVGSVSKQFCAACILFLCEQKVLSVDDTLDKFYPNDKINKKLTVKHLLNMSSGFRNYLDFVDQSMVGENEWDNVNTITREIFKQDPGFEPGEDYEYSNSNYFLLANIVEKASGIAYHKFLREQFLEPLEMTHTGFVEEISGAPAWASALAAGELKENYFYFPGMTKGAGDIVTNAEDMDKWMRGLSEGKVLSTEGFRQMTESINPNSVEEYGYGLWHMPYGGVGHVGQIPPSFGAVDYINTERDVNLFAASNSGRGMSYVQELPQELLSVLFEE